MTAEALRRAAALMRERAEGATVATRGWFSAASLTGFHEPENAEHIASWHPAVALAVADWLDMADHAIRSSPYPPVLAGSPDMLAALAVARAFLGETP